MSEFNLVKLLRESIGLILVGTFCAFTVNFVLGQKGQAKKYVSKWAVTILAAMLILTISNIGMHFFMQYVMNVITSERLQADPSLDVAINMLTLAYNMAIMLFPAILSLFGALWAYEQEKSVKIFTAVLTGLIASIIYRYVYVLAQLPFFGGDNGQEGKYYPPLIISMVLLSVCLLLFYWINQKKLSAKLKLLLDTPDGRVDSFVKIPVLSIAVFAFLVAILRTFNIDPSSIYWQNVLIFGLVFGCLIIIYAMMYWSIFRGITLSTAAMKSHAELDVAKNLQASVLPNTFPAFPQRKEFSIFATMNPAKEVGGDFYDFFFTDENHLAVVIADVSGKGIPAALFMMTARTLLKNLTKTGRMPEEVLAEANNQLCENNEAAMFVTVWLGILEIDSGRLTFVNAGHNPPLLKQGDSEYRYLDHKTYKRSIMLGMRENIAYKSNEIQLKTNDFLLLYTDGVTEATNTKKELFGENRLKYCADENGSSKPEQLLPLIKATIDNFVGAAEQFDDITMLALQLEAITQVYETDVGLEYVAGISEFAENFLEKSGCGTKVIRQALIAVDEIFSNIVNYSGADKATLRCLAVGQEITLSFEDNGKAYNPMDAEEPDITAPQEEREIGGLGIFIVKKSMDDVRYEYRNGRNILTLRKKLK